MRLKFCASPGCQVMIPQGQTRCPKHAGVGGAFDGAIRTNGHLYNTRRWRNLRADVIRQHPYCVRCQRTTGLTVDHIQPPRGDEVLFWDPDNLEVICHEDQARKTAAEVRARKNEYKTN